MDVNPIKLMDLAKMASEQYLQDGVPLNKAIAGIAEMHELNPFQIERVAEIANHEVNLVLLKKSADKSFTFDLADPKAITCTIRGATNPLAKTASAQMEDLSKAFAKTFDAPDMPSFGREDAKDFSRFERGIDLTLRKLASKAESFRREFEGRRLMTLSDVEKLASDITKVAKDHILLNNGKLSDLLKYACIADPGAKGLYKELFEQVRTDLMKLGAPVDRSLICDSLEIPGGTLEVINGGHTLAILLDTFKRKISEEDKLAFRTRLMDTFGNAVVDQIKVLKTPEDVDADMYKGFMTLDKKAEASTADEFVDFIQAEAMHLPVGKIALVLGALGLAKLLGESTRSGVKKTIEETTQEPYNERMELGHRARSIANL